MKNNELIESNRNMSSLKSQMHAKGYQQAVNDLELRTLNATLARLKEMKLSGESIDEAINSLTREVLTLEKPLDLKREDRQAICPVTGRFVPYYLT